jgi:hypothetical protein
MTKLKLTKLKLTKLKLTKLKLTKLKLTKLKNDRYLGRCVDNRLSTHFAFRLLFLEVFQHV